MPKFRKKPIVVEAIQWTGENLFEIYEFMYNKPDLSHSIASEKWEEYERIIVEEGLRISTLKSGDGTQKGDIDDWIIKGAKGEFYPCKPDIFKLTYEPA